MKVDIAWMTSSDKCVFFFVIRDDVKKKRDNISKDSKTKSIVNNEEKTNIYNKPLLRKLRNDNNKKSRGKLMFS